MYRQPDKDTSREMNWQLRGYMYRQLREEMYRQMQGQIYRQPERHIQEDLQGRDVQTNAGSDVSRVRCTANQGRDVKTNAGTAVQATKNRWANIFQERRTNNWGKSCKDKLRDRCTDNQRQTYPGRCTDTCGKRCTDKCRDRCTDIQGQTYSGKYVQTIEGEM
jgi:hypothetical protein